jgi:hypothetical protein
MALNALQLRIIRIYERIVGTPRMIGNINGQGSTVPQQCISSRAGVPAMRDGMAENGGVRRAGSWRDPN